MQGSNVGGKVLLFTGTAVDWRISRYLQGLGLHESFRVWFEVIDVGSLRQGPMSCPFTPTPPRDTASFQSLS
jgi:hypothetical protein